jgi:hypothetical protein
VWLTRFGNGIQYTRIYFQTLIDIFIDWHLHQSPNRCCSWSQRCVEQMEKI